MWSVRLDILPFCLFTYSKSIWEAEYFDKNWNQKLEAFCEIHKALDIKLVDNICSYGVGPINSVSGDLSAPFFLQLVCLFYPDFISRAWLVNWRGKKRLDLVIRASLKEKLWKLPESQVWDIRIALTFAGNYSDSFISAVHSSPLSLLVFLWLLQLPGRSLLFLF